ncbi:GerAB/ArcD/ProY family transporter [Bacillus cereus]|uniref:Spore germination protein (Amino acid permease) n=1 Tax=Bacillus cereus VD184 TaxID=1053242 RepID=A0A9W5R5K8_BACCE|nr:endospore germination permease [Bacillus cereus]EOQ08969.1 spore germination protein (amino acid permease) [Bacillus cereus VD184]
MNKNTNLTITNTQYIFIIHGAQMGVGVLQIPRELAEKAGMNGWLSLISGWIFSIAASILIIQVMKKHPKLTLLDLLEFYFGKWVGKGFGLIFFSYFLFLTFVVIQKTILYIQVWIIPRTAEYIMMGLIALPIFIIVRNGIQIVGRYAEFIFFIAIGIILLYIFPLKQSFHLEHLYPLFQDINTPLAHTFSTAISFLGFEITFLLYPFLENKSDATKGIILANSITLAILLYITLACFLFFSPDEITQFNEPPLSMLKVIEFRFLERVEIIYLALYLYIVSTTWMPYVFSATYCLYWVDGKQQFQTHLLSILFVFIIIFYFSPSTLYQNNFLQSLCSKLGVIFAYIFPFCLWVYSYIDNWMRRRILK